MHKYSEQEISDLRNKFLSNVAIAQERGRAGEKYHAELEINKSNLVAVNERIREIYECVKHMDDICHNIEHYAKEHQQTAKTILDRAISEAGALVPDAGVANAHIKYTGQHATIVNQDEQSINAREGGGYRAVLGILLRYALMKAGVGVLPLMLMDEQLFALSDGTTALLKDVLVAMKRDISIIIIEQRRNVADGIADKEYQFVKKAFPDGSEQVFVVEGNV